jgi:calpain-15
MYFKGINVCKVRNWDDVRIKGKFIKVTDIEDSNIDVVLSKWYYTFPLSK